MNQMLGYISYTSNIIYNDLGACGVVEKKLLVWRGCGWGGLGGVVDARLLNVALKTHGIQ